jgi:hypothetical protein
MPKEIVLQYFDGCPNWKTAQADLVRAVDMAGVDVDIRYERIGSQEEADKVRFRGSPTILVDGVDPWARPDDPVGLSCRVYRTELGTAGSPGAEALAELLARRR